MGVSTMFVGLFAGDGFVAVEARRVWCEAAVMCHTVRLPWIGYVGYARYEWQMSIRLCDRCNRCNRGFVFRGESPLPSSSSIS
jgi:hypothetical protein